MPIDPILKTLTLQTLDIIYSGGIGKLGVPFSVWNQARRPRLSGLTLVESNSFVETWGYDKWGPKGIGCSDALKCKYFVFKNNQTSKKTLFIIFCYGASTNTKELDQIWSGSDFRNTIIAQIQKANGDDYTSIVMGGQSMGAAMSYYYTTKLYAEGVIESIPAGRLNIIVFGLGRIPTRIVNDFTQIYDESYFNVIDIITYNSQENIPDAFMDLTTLYDNRCDIENPQQDDPTRSDAPYYCYNANIYGTIPPYKQAVFGKPPINYTTIAAARGWDVSYEDDYDRDVEISDAKAELASASVYNKYAWDLAVTKFAELKEKAEQGESAGRGGGGGGAESLSEKERTLFEYLRQVQWKNPYMKICSNYSSWGPPYGELYNTCQKIHDIFHSHTNVNTYSINENGNLEAINKNNFMRAHKIKLTNWGPITGPPNMWGAELAPYVAGKSNTTLGRALHEIKSYNRYFIANEQSAVAALGGGGGGGGGAMSKVAKAARASAARRGAAAETGGGGMTPQLGAMMQTNPFITSLKQFGQYLIKPPKKGGKRRRKRKKTKKRRKKKKRSTRRRK